MKQYLAVGYLLILCIYPFFAYAMTNWADTNPNYLFGFIGLIFLSYQIIDTYGRGRKLRVPYYLVFLGCFAFYTVLSGIFISGDFMEVGPLKFIYSNYFIQGFIAFLLVENTYFPPQWIKRATRIIGALLIIALGVSIIQISDPLFFLNTYDLKEGMSVNQMEAYYSDNPKERSNYAMLVMDGYRFSIYSWISNISIGIDSLAVYSLLFAGIKVGRVKKGILTVVAGLIAFLSSARWIMLNFLVISAQNLLIQRNKIIKGVKYVVVGAVLIIALGTVASSMGVDIPRFINERLMSKSANTRIYAFEVFGKLFPKNPIFGAGNEDSPELKRLITGRTSQIHVGYLYLFYIYGLVGGIIYLSFLGSFLNRFLKTARQSQYWGAFFAVLGLAIANLTLVKLDPFLYGLLLATIFSNYYSGENELLNPAPVRVQSPEEKEPPQAKIHHMPQPSTDEIQV